MHAYLDFEAPLAELEGKIAELKAIAGEDSAVSINEEIKALEKIPTLVISANVPPRKEMQQRQIAFLKKPFDLNDLFKSIEKLLAQGES